MFVLERADTMNDEAANALLKTLEEPAGLRRPAAAHRPPDAGAADDRLALPAGALRRAAARRARRPAASARAPRRRRPRRPRGSRSATASGRSRSRSATGRRCARAPRRSRAPRCTAASAPSARGSRCSRPPPARGAAARAEHEERLAEELQFLPKKEHKRRETEIGEQARRAERRAQTAALDHGLQLAGLWYRDLACVAAGAPELVHHADRAAELARGRRGARASRRCARPPSWSTTPAPGSRST